MTYRFFAPADEAQDAIYTYTVEVWGEAQAARYIEGLHAHLARTARNRGLWRKLPFDYDPETPAVYMTRYERHFVFFRELSGGAIGVISILHSQMDLPHHLAEDLIRLDPDGDG